jgi:hypothetical protein
LRPIHADPVRFQYAVSGDPVRAAPIVAQLTSLPFERIAHG